MTNERIFDVILCIWNGLNTSFGYVITSNTTFATIHGTTITLILRNLGTTQLRWLTLFPQLTFRSTARLSRKWGEEHKGRWHIAQNWRCGQHSWLRCLRLKPSPLFYCIKKPLLTACRRQVSYNSPDCMKLLFQKLSHFIKKTIFFLDFCKLYYKGSM